VTHDTIPTAPFLQVVDKDLQARGMSRADLCELMADRFGEKPATHRKRLWQAERDGVIRLDVADRLLTVLGLHLDDIPDAPKPTGPRVRCGGKPAGVYGYLTDAQLRACHVLYQQGLSTRQVAERILPRTRYTSLGSCVMALLDGWRRLGLPTRTRAEANRLRCTKHGLSPRSHPDQQHRRALRVARGDIQDQPCQGVRTQPPRKGEPCRRPALRGEEYCHAHHPDRQAALHEHLALVRARKEAA